MSNAEVKAYFAAMQTDAEGGSLEAAKKYVAHDRDYWSGVITAAGVKPE